MSYKVYDKLDPAVMETLDECIAIRNEMMNEKVSFAYGTQLIHQHLLSIPERAQDTKWIYRHDTIRYKGWVWIHINPTGTLRGFWYMLGVEGGE